MKKKSKIIAFTAPLVLGVASLSAGAAVDKKNTHEFNAKTESAIDKRIQKPSDTVQAEVAACLQVIDEGKVKIPSTKSELATFRRTTLDHDLFKEGITEVQVSSSSIDYSYAETYPCSTSDGIAYIGYTVEKNSYTCSNTKNKMFVAFPVVPLNDKATVILKISGEKEAPMAAISPMVYLYTSTGSDDFHHNRTVLLHDTPDGTRQFIEITLSESIEDRIRGNTDNAKAWQPFMEEVFAKKRVEADKKDAERELVKYKGDMHALLKDYIDGLSFSRNVPGRAGDVSLEKVKPLLLARFEHLYRYLEKNGGKEKKEDIARNFYRFLRCNPVNTSIERLPWGVGGEHKVDSRNVKIDDEVMSDKPEDIADIWFHEIIHAMTLEQGFGWGIANYNVSIARVFLEGMAELSVFLSSPSSIRKGAGGIEYSDFALLTGSFLGKEGYLQSFTEEGGFYRNINYLYDERIEKFMKRWKIAPEYRDDLFRVFGNGDPFSDLSYIKIDDNRRYALNHLMISGRRLYVLREILRKNGIPWGRFTTGVSRDFAVSAIRVSLR